MKKIITAIFLLSASFVSAQPYAKYLGVPTDSMIVRSSILVNSAGIRYLTASDATLQAVTTAGNTTTNAITVGNATISAANPIPVINATTTTVLSGWSFRGNNTEEGFLKYQPNIAELRFSMGRSSGWGGNIDFYADQTQKMSITQSTINTYNGNLTVNGTTPLLGINGSVNSSPLGIEFRYNGVIEGYAKFQPNVATMYYNAGRTGGYGGKYIWLVDTSERARLDSATFRIDADIAFPNTESNRSLRANSFYFDIGGGSELSFSTYNNQASWQKRAFLSADGNFGLDNQFPSALLDVKRSARIGGGLRVANTRDVHQVYCMGNSLTANGTYEQQLNSLLGATWNVHNKGISGNTTTTMAGRFARDVVNSGDAEYTIIMGGINDVAQDANYTTITANLQSMYTAADIAGITVVAVTPTPFKGNASWTTTRQAVLDSVVQWILDTPSGVDYVIDAYSSFEDPSHADSLLPAYNSGDNLHYSTAGYQALGTLIYNGVTWTSVAAPITALTIVGQSKLDDMTVDTAGKISLYGNSAPTNGQILIGNSSNGTFEKAAPTNSSTVTWTLGAGTITANTVLQQITGTASGDGVATSFNITLPASATWAMVGAKSNDAGGIWNWTVSGTTLTIRHSTPPASGTNNLEYWIEYK